MAEQYANRSGRIQLTLCGDGARIFHYAIMQANQITTTGQTNLSIFERGETEALINTAEQRDQTPDRIASARLRTLVENSNTNANFSSSQSNRLSRN